MEQVISLNDREWKEFFFEDVLIVKSGKRLTKADMVEGERPFIGASDSNNGITFFTSSVNESLDKNVLGVNYNGSVGFSFYHPYQALFSDDVKRVSWIKKERNNRYTLLFLSCIIHQQKDKYAYGYKFNGQRMKRQKILLPVTSMGVPDWAFMEAYMRQKEQEILKPTIERLCKHLISNQLTRGGVIRSVQIGKHFTSLKYSQKFNEANALKKQTTYRGIVPMCQQPHLTMELMVLSEIRAA